MTNAVTLTELAGSTGRPSIGGQRQTRPVVSSVVSQLPGSFSPAKNLGHAAVTPAPATRVFAVEDRVPAGWRVSEITQNGVRAQLGRIKWGFRERIDNAGYQVTAPDILTNALAPSRTGSFDGVNFPITGQRQMTD